MHGGLKLDLERVIEMDAEEFNRSFLPRVDNDDRMFPSNLPASLLGPLGDTGPRWDVLRLFPQMTRSAIDSFPLTPFFESSWQGRFQMGVAPVLAHFQVYAGMTLVDRGEEMQTDSKGNNDSSDDEHYYAYWPRIYFLPTIVLWNPYDVALEAPPSHLVWTHESGAIRFGCEGYSVVPTSDDLASGDFIVSSLGQVEFPYFLDKGEDDDKKVYMRFVLPAHL